MNVDFSLDIYYYAMGYSYLSYGVVKCDGAVSVASNKRLLIAQKRLIRLIFGLTNTDSCKPILKKKKNLTVPGIYVYLQMLR